MSAPLPWRQTSFPLGSPHKFESGQCRYWSDGCSPGPSALLAAPPGAHPFFCWGWAGPSQPLCTRLQASASSQPEAEPLASQTDSSWLYSSAVRKRVGIPTRLRSPTTLRDCQDITYSMFPAPPWSLPLLPPPQYQNITKLPYQDGAS